MPGILDGELTGKLSVFSRQERCVMKKEFYRVKRPGYLVFGNSILFLVIRSTMENEITEATL